METALFYQKRSEVFCLEEILQQSGFIKNVKAFCIFHATKERQLYI